MDSISKGYGPRENWLDSLTPQEQQALGTLNSGFKILSKGEDSFKATDIAPADAPNPTPDPEPEPGHQPRPGHDRHPGRDHHRKPKPEDDCEPFEDLKDEIRKEATVRRGEGYWHVAARLLDLDVHSKEHKDQIEICRLAELLEKINHNKPLFTGNIIPVVKNLDMLIKCDPYFEKVLKAQEKDNNQAHAA